MNKLILQNRYNFFLFIIILTLYYQKLYSQNFWQELPIPTAQLDEIKAISISSIGNILVGTFNFGNGKLYQSSDNGDSWTQLNYNGYGIYSILQLPNGHILLGTMMGIKKSTDNGSTWQDVTGNFLGVNVYCFLRKSDGTLFVGASNGVHISIDNGDHWTQINNGLPSNNAFVYALAINSQGTLFAGVTELITGRGVYRSTDNGQNWVQVNNGFSTIPTVYSLTVAPNNEIYCGTLANGIYKSADNGDSWTRVSQFNNSAIVYCMLSTDDGLVLATDGAGLYYTSNSGASWNLTGWGIISSIKSLAQHPNGLFFVGVQLYGKVYRSTTPITNIEEPTIVKKFYLYQNYPNPFNPSTTISFTIPQSEFVTLKVYDVLGNEVATLVNETLSAGNHSYNFDASNLTSGVYFYKLQAGRFSEGKKMILTK